MKTTAVFAALASMAVIGTSDAIAVSPLQKRVEVSKPSDPRALYAHFATQEFGDEGTPLTNSTSGHEWSTEDKALLGVGAAIGVGIIVVCCDRCSRNVPVSQAVEMLRIA